MADYDRSCLVAYITFNLILGRVGGVGWGGVCRTLNYLTREKSNYRSLRIMQILR